MNIRKPVYRICAVTRELHDRKELFRVVKTKEGKIFIDESYSIKGRGVYISKSLKVIEQANKNKILSKALRCKVDDEVYMDLVKHLGGIK